MSAAIRKHLRLPKRAASASLAVDTFDAAADPLGEFGSEFSDPQPTQTFGPVAAGGARRGWMVWALALLVLAQMPVVAIWVMDRPLLSAAGGGAVHIESAPAGAEVRMDGRALGVTPLALTLDAGDRVLELQYGGVVRQVTVNVRSGETIRQRIEFVSAPAAPVASRGALSVTTEPGRAPVIVDGTERGVSPLVVSNLAPGDHTVTVRFPTGNVARRIRVDAGATASFVATMPSAPGAVSGYLSVDVPHRLQILEQGRLIGTTDFARLMLPAGEHTLEFVDDELGFRTRRDVRVNPAATTTIAIDLPRAPLAINAQPWASVWVDGEAAGDTPIGNLMPRIGRHEVVFRHPELGERRASVLVTLKGPARIGVDLRR